MSRSMYGLGVAAIVGGLSAIASPSGSPAAYCRHVVNDAATRPIPPALASASRRALGLQLSDAEIQRTGVYRCMSGRILVCAVGANLNCGRADLQTRLPAADQYCRANPGATFVPMVVTGHATIYDWSCSGPRAIAGKSMQSVDSQGFTTGLWATLP